MDQIVRRILMTGKLGSSEFVIIQIRNSEDFCHAYGEITIPVIDLPMLTWSFHVPETQHIIMEVERICGHTDMGHGYRIDHPNMRTLQ